MVLSWSLTEVVRYTFYACNLLGTEPAPLLFLRYTLFYVLYPTGASSEALLIYATIPPPGLGFGHPLTPNVLAGVHTYVRQYLFLVWWPGKRCFFSLCAQGLELRCVDRAVCDVHAHDEAEAQSLWGCEQGEDARSQAEVAVMFQWKCCCNQTCFA